jgi:ketosteroid isomerase-like protein
MSVADADADRQRDPGQDANAIAFSPVKMIAIAMPPPSNRISVSTRRIPGRGCSIATRAGSRRAAPAGYCRVMSRENVEIVRRGVDSFNRRDIAAILTDFDQDAEWVEDQRYPGAQTFRGPSGVERSITKWWEAWGEIVMELDETIDLGDRVVLSGRVQARGHNSDVAVEAPFGGVYEFRAGKVVRVQVLGSRDEAIEAAGRSE